MALLVFALLYLYWSPNFWQSTAVAEGRIRNTQGELEIELESVFSSILKQFEKHVKAIRDIDVKVIGASSADISFVVFYRWYTVRSASPSMKHVTCCLSIPTERTHDGIILSELPILIADPSGHFLTWFALVEEKGYGGYSRVGALRARIERTPDDFESPGEMDGALSFDDRLFSLAQRFQKLSMGETAHDSGGFWRWLYFSAVTITTLGYGDLVPLTNSARMLVAIEAVLGVMIAGLFLNAVASKYGAKNGGADKKHKDVQQPAPGDSSKATDHLTGTHEN